MEFKTRFVRPVHPGFEPVGDSLTQQHFKDECDINYIIKHYSEPQYQTLGSIKTPRVPLWGDFSAIPDLRSAHEAFAVAEASFACLPADVRKRFNNNPLDLLQFVSDSSNRDEAIKLGLLRKDAPTVSVVGKADPVSAVNEPIVEHNVETAQQ